MQTATEAGRGGPEPPKVSTAGRLKYAEPRSLPSFPSIGLSSGGAAASAAASLGWSNQKPVEPWRPDRSSSASAAAVLAKDYKMAPSWEPTSDSAGHKAAILAVGSAGAALKKPNENKSPQYSWGSSAATQAFHASRPASAEQRKLSNGGSAATSAFKTSRSQSMQKSDSPPTLRGDRSLAAAKGAMSSPKHVASHSASGSHLYHKESHPTDTSTASKSALEGATKAHRASMNNPPLGDVGAVSVTTMTRNMFTSHPPAKTEVDERTNNERLHQSAVEMAKHMYQQQQKSQEAAEDAHDGSEVTSPSPILNLQDAAYRQAQLRLSKLQDEHYKNQQMQEYYGNEKSPRRRFSVISKLRRRSSSEGDMDDRERSEKIRQQMSLFSSQLSQVDKEKRDKDREALLAAAQRNVKARLQGMDEKVFSETGRVNPTMLGDWEITAQQEAQHRHEERNQGRGKINIGGGKFMDAEEVDAIAAKRVQPVLDDIHQKAEAKRDRLAAIKMEDDTKKAEAEREKSRERELKGIHKRVKEDDRQQEKAKKLQEKQEDKARREEEKAAKAEQKRLAKEEKRRSKSDVVTHSPEPEPAREEPERVRAEGAGEGDEGNEEEARSLREANASGGSPTAEPNMDGAENGTQRKAPEEPSSPTSRVKGWIKNRFSRGKSIGDQGEKQKGFVGGAALREPGANGSTASLEHRSSSMRDVAMAGKAGDDEVGNNAKEDTNRDSRGVSPVSPSSERGEASGQRASLEPPKPIADNAPRQSSSPTRDSRFREIIDH